jgi:hypothetical protein
MNLILFLCSLAAFADSEVHLGPAYKVQATPPSAAAADISYVVVEKSGVRYKRFSGSGADLYVLDSQALSKASIESGQCADPREVKSARAGDPSSVTIVQAETKLSDSDVKLFGGLIQDTTYNKCNNYETAQKKRPALDLGVSKTVTDPNGTTKEYKIFNSNLKKNLNFSGQF